MIVPVTLPDIDNGSPGDCRFNPVGLALKRATGISLHVTPEYIAHQDESLTAGGCCVVEGSPDGLRMKTPLDVSDFIEDFDCELPDECPVKPFKFDLSGEFVKGCQKWEAGKRLGWKLQNVWSI